MAIPIIAAGVSALGSALGSLIGAKQSGKNVQDQRKADMELAKYQHGKDVEMWERSNLYNEPSQQMARLRKAGLNPALMYGTGSGANQGSSTLPKYQAIKTDYSKRRNPLEALGALGMYQNLTLGQARIDNVRAKTEGEQLRNGITSLNKRMRDFEVSYKLGKVGKIVDPNFNNAKMMMRPYMGWMLDSQLDAIRTQNKLREQSLKLSGQRTQGASQENKLRKFELDFWNTLQKEGKMLKFGLPFMRMLLGR